MGKQILLVVLDGWGYREATAHNAIAAAEKPFFDSLWRRYPHTFLKASGKAVGLPQGQMGNSEVGHMTIGAGRPIDTDVVRINKAIANGKFKTNPAFTKLFKHVKKYRATLHVQGLLSPGGIHSHQRHLHEFLKLAKKAGITKIAIHAFTDGRDTSPQSAHRYLTELEKIIAKLGVGFIATVAGRFYAMDRDQNWHRLKIAEAAMFKGVAKKSFKDKPSIILKNLYTQGLVDEHVEPMIFLDKSGRGYQIQNNDGIFFFNFRADRARMLSKKIVDRAEKQNIFFVTMTEYDKNLASLVAFPPIVTAATLGSEISGVGLRQAHIAETEKYAHATYFFNVGREAPYPGEKRVLVPSRKNITTHDQAPAMRANEIATAGVKALKSGANFVFVNFANADMVGHTGHFEATKQAVQAVDGALQKLVSVAINLGGTAVITADHGNAELNFNATEGVKHTAHTTNPVPFIVTVLNKKLKPTGTLADVAPTVLELFNIPIPQSMLGKSLLK